MYCSMKLRKLQEKILSEQAVLAVLAVLCVMLYFIGNGLLAVTDPVEVNYTETAKEMLAAGDWFSPRIYGKYWYDKPVFFYWELLTAFKLFGISDFAARFFPAIFATVGVYLAYFFGKYLYDVKTGFVSALILATSVEYWYLGHAVITDGTLFVTVSSCLMAFYLAYDTGKDRFLYVSGVMAALAVLTKGPVGVLLPGLIVFVFLLWQRNVSYIVRPHMAGSVILFLVLAGLWYVPMYRMHGQAFITTFLGTHNVLRAVTAEHPGNNVWYYYVPVWLVGFFPWSMLYVPKLRAMVKKRTAILPEKSGERFLFLWFSLVFLAFECMASKYMTYTFPYLMPLAVGTAPYFVKLERLVKGAVTGMAVIFLIGLFTVAVPQTHKESAEDETVLLNELTSGDTLIVSYGERYPASFVYYSGRHIDRLETQENIEKYKPRGMTWSDTNVMPFMAIEDLPAHKDILVITDHKNAAAVCEDLPGTWEEAGAAGRFVFFRRCRQ